MEKVETKDWSQLPHGLIVSITNRLGAFEDLVAFSSVCTCWRSALRRQQNWSKRCVPWLLLRKRDPSLKLRHYFLTPTMNKENNRYDVDEPLITNSKHFWGSSIGWIFTLAHDNTTSLINPLTGHRITLPSFSQSIKRALLFLKGTDTSDDIFVMIIYYDRYQSRLAFARPGFLEWITLQDHEDCGVVDVAYYENKILGVRANGALVMCDTDNVSCPRVSSFAPTELVNFNDLGMTHLVESAGDLLLVLVRRIFSEKKEAFKVYKFDIDTRNWAELDDLGDRALFVGVNCSISVSHANGVDCIGNCIYSSSNMGLVIFYMKDRRPEVYGFPYFSEKYSAYVSTKYLASLLGVSRPVWITPSLT